MYNPHAHILFAATSSHRTYPSTSSSIPSRYKTFFFANTERKGFNSQTARFSAEQNIVCSLIYSYTSCQYIVSLFISCFISYTYITTAYTRMRILGLEHMVQIIEPWNKLAHFLKGELEDSHQRWGHTYIPSFHIIPTYLSSHYSVVITFSWLLAMIIMCTLYHSMHHRGRKQIWSEGHVSHIYSQTLI